jgi:hypothetical protein
LRVEYCHNQMTDIQHVIDVLTSSVFFEIVMLPGLSNLSKVCKAFRYLQLDKDSLLAAIVGSTRAKLHLSQRISLFGMMPRAMNSAFDTTQSQNSLLLIRAARSYEKQCTSNRRRTYPCFYAFAYYHGICGGNRQCVWGEVADILCEMAERGEYMDLTGPESAPWGLNAFSKRRTNARHYTSYYKHRSCHSIESCENLMSAINSTNEWRPVL